jgi:hypothetical protein
MLNHSIPAMFAIVESQTDVGLIRERNEDWLDATRTGRAPWSSAKIEVHVEDSPSIDAIGDNELTSANDMNTDLRPPATEHFWARTMCWMLPDGRYRTERVEVHQVAPNDPQWFVREVYDNAELQMQLGPYVPSRRVATLKEFQSENFDSIISVYPIEILALVNPLDTMRYYAADTRSVRRGTILGLPVNIYRVRVDPSLDENDLEVSPRFGAEAEIWESIDGRFVLGWDTYELGSLLTRTRVVQLTVNANMDESALFSRMGPNPTNL